MRGVFDDGEDERAAPRRDTELTLGSFTLLAIFFGLVVVCGLFFGLGYAMGRRGAQAAPAATPAAVPAAVQVNSSRSKPSATSQTGAAQAAQATPPDANPTAGQGSDAGLKIADETAGTGSSAGRPVVQPALPNATPPQAAAPKAEPVNTAPVSLMVQIAAVSDPQDADVLVAALRKRGYVVTAHRDAGDGLIHVRLGPLNSRDEAAKWRQKLLNDGYNAIVQP